MSADKSPTEAGLLHRTVVLFRLATHGRIARTSLMVAVVVGTVLNAINNGAKLINGETINWFQFSLNFIVPYCVASYGAAKNELQRARNE